MENIRNFLESSTIHGLNYISTTRKYVRLFWIIVVIAGFTGAGIMIYTSFQDWDESPVTTTIETCPINEITFPKVTVCPPKNTFTDLNQNLLMTQNMTLDTDIRTELQNFAIEAVNDCLHDNILKNLSLLQDNERYSNWYHGNTRIDVPYYSCNTQSCTGIYYEVDTHAIMGNISTEHFGGTFVADKLETNVYFTVHIYPPNSLMNNPNVTLHVEIEKSTMNDLLGGQDTFLTFSNDWFSDDVNSSARVINKNYSPPGDYGNKVSLIRKVTEKDLKEIDMKVMPGFRLIWFYSGNFSEADLKSAYSDADKTKEFVRNGSMK